MKLTFPIIIRIYTGLNAGLGFMRLVHLVRASDMLQLLNIVKHRTAVRLTWAASVVVTVWMWGACMFYMVVCLIIKPWLQLWFDCDTTTIRLRSDYDVLWRIAYITIAIRLRYEDRLRYDDITTHSTTTEVIEITICVYYLFIYYMV